MLSNWITASQLVTNVTDPTSKEAVYLISEGCQSEILHHFSDSLWHSYPCCIIHIMHALLSALTVHYKCHAVFCNYLITHKILKTCNTTQPSMVC